MWREAIIMKIISSLRISKNMILTINASPHKNSTTEKFCEYFEKKLKTEYKRINLTDWKIPPSDGTYRKVKGFKKLQDLVLQSDGIFIASPTYWYNVPSTLKSFIEQLTPIDSKLWQRERLLAVAVY